MGLENNSKNVTYVKLKGGKFYISRGDDTPYDQLEGIITRMSYKDDEYNGVVSRVLVLTISDDVNYQLSIKVESGYYSSLISFLKNVDITKPVVLVPTIKKVKKDGEEKERYSIFISQNGKFAKNYFTKDTPNGLPKWNVVTVGKKTVVDKTDYLEFLENIVNTEFVPKLSTDMIVHTKVPSNVNTEVDDVEEDEEEKTLPWD